MRVRCSNVRLSLLKGGLSSCIIGLALISTPALGQNFGNMMNPGSWFGSGSDRDRGYDDRYPRGMPPPSYGYPPYGQTAPHGMPQQWGSPYGQQPQMGFPTQGAPSFGGQSFGAPMTDTWPGSDPRGMTGRPSAGMDPVEQRAQQRIRELEQRIEELERRQREPVRPSRPEFLEPEFPPLRY